MIWWIILLCIILLAWEEGSKPGDNIDL